jgi:hypothetical protein
VVSRWFPNAVLKTPRAGLFEKLAPSLQSASIPARHETRQRSTASLRPSQRRHRFLNEFLHNGFGVRLDDAYGNVRVASLSLVRPMALGYVRT